MTDHRLAVSTGGCHTRQPAPPLEGTTTMHFIRRLMLFAILAGVATAVMRKLRGGGECGPGCDCSQGAQSCACGHGTCLAPSEA